MATAVAALMAKARREVEDLFFNNDAFGPDRAVEFEPRLPVQKRFLDQLIAEGVVHEAGPGRYWLDLNAWKESRRKRLVWGLWILALAVIVVIAVTLAKRFF